MDTTQKPKVEKNRPQTEQRLIDGLGRIIERDGFEGLTLKAVSEESGVPRPLVYRYFGSLDGLIVAYIHQHDFWTAHPSELPPNMSMADILKGMMQVQIMQLRRNTPLRRIYRWTLTSAHPMLAQIRRRINHKGIELTSMAAERFGVPQAEIASIGAILGAAIVHLSMQQDHSPEYVGIPLDNDAGWAQIGRTIDTLIDLWADEMTTKYRTK